MIHISNANKKIESDLKSPDNNVKEVREVEDKPVKKVKKVKTKNTNTKKQAPSKVTSYEAESTKSLDKDEIAKASKPSVSSSKYEVLGRVPSYEKGDLDV